MPQILKEMHLNGQSSIYIDALRRLFNLDEEEKETPRDPEA